MTLTIPEGMLKSPFFNRDNIIGEDDYAFVWVNEFPVTTGHLLVIPKREVVSFFDLTPEEFLSHHTLAHRAVAQLRKHYNPDGFNIGWNDGIAGGQTVAHAHMHIIPRYHQMNQDLGIAPRGGIVNMIPKLDTYYDPSSSGKDFTAPNKITLAFDRI